MVKTEFDEKGATAGLMVRMTKPLWGTGAGGGHGQQLLCTGGIDCNG